MYSKDQLLEFQSDKLEERDYKDCLRHISSSELATELDISKNEVERFEQAARGDVHAILMDVICRWRRQLGKIQELYDALGRMEDRERQQRLLKKLQDKYNPADDSKCVSTSSGTQEEKTSVSVASERRPSLTDDELLAKKASFLSENEYYEVLESIDISLLAIRLDIESGKMKLLKREHRDDMPSLITGVIAEWRDKQGKVRELYAALKKMNNNVKCEALVEKLREKQRA